MFEDDYILRLIREIVRTIMKLIFHIDTESPAAQMIEDKNLRETTEKLLQKIDSGEINAAENELTELLENKTPDALLAGLVFYSHLSRKDEDFLKLHDFSKKEVEEGVKNLISEFGLEGMADVFLDE